VIIPDATSKGEHGDKSMATTHVIGLLVRRPNAADVHIPIAGKRVRIVADGESERPTVTTSFLFVPPLHTMTNPDGTPPAAQVRRRKDEAAVSVNIEMTGGSMLGELITHSGIELPVHLNPPMAVPLASMPLWQSSAASGRIEIDGGPAIALDASVQAFIYNWDEASPSADELTKTIELPSIFQDHDFKWVYALLDPPANMTWEEWLGSDPFLPAPRSIHYLANAEPQAIGAAKGFLDLSKKLMANAMVASPASPITELTPPVPHPSTGTCDSARWREPEEL
jgi:hypothetical protein